MAHERRRPVGHAIKLEGPEAPHEQHEQHERAEHAHDLGGDSPAGKVRHRSLRNSASRQSAARSSQYYRTNEAHPEQSGQIGPSYILLSGEDDLQRADGAVSGAA